MALGMPYMKYLKTGWKDYNMTILERFLLVTAGIITGAAIVYTLDLYVYQDIFTELLHKCGEPCLFQPE